MGKKTEKTGFPHCPGSGTTFVQRTGQEDGVWNSIKTKSVSFVRKVVVAVLGGTVLLVGVAMILTPGPAILVIPVGLAILAVEFAWARNLLKSAKSYVGRKTQKNGPAASPGDPLPPA